MRGRGHAKSGSVQRQDGGGAAGAAAAGALGRALVGPGGHPHGRALCRGSLPGQQPRRRGGCARPQDRHRPRPPRRLQGTARGMLSPQVLGIAFGEGVPRGDRGAAVTARSPHGSPAPASSWLAATESLGNNEDGPKGARSLSSFQTGLLFPPAEGSPLFLSPNKWSGSICWVLSLKSL